MKRKLITFQGKKWFKKGEWRKLKPESNSATKKFMVEDLRFVTDLLKKNNIEYFPSWGTLLGLIREGDVIEGDDDLDFCFDAKDEKRLISAFLKYDQVFYYDIHSPIKSPYNIVQFRIPRKDFTTLIDFYPYENTEKDYIIDYYNHADYGDMVPKEKCIENKTALHMPKRYIFPLVEATFKNCTSKIPNDPIAMLEWSYGGTWSKKLEKGKDYSFEIKNNAPIVKET